MENDSHCSVNFGWGPDAKSPLRLGHQKLEKINVLLAVFFGLFGFQAVQTNVLLEFIVASCKHVSPTISASIAGCVLVDRVDTHAELTDGMRRFDRDLHDGIVLDDVRDLGFSCTAPREVARQIRLRR